MNELLHTIHISYFEVKNNKKGTNTKYKSKES